MEQAEINLQVRQLVSSHLMGGVAPEQIDDEIYVGTASGFDSSQLLEFILSIEDEFGIVVPDEDLTLDNFDSISKISQYIKQQIGG